MAQSPSLVKATNWARATFKAGSLPSREKIIKWIEAGDIPGVLIGGCPYVDEKQFMVELSTGCSTPTTTNGLSGLDLLR